MKTKIPDIKIESGVPIPEGYGRGEQNQIRKALRSMKRGDSFMYPKSTAAINAAKRSGIKIITRKINGEGYRIWRIK